ncbi:hypothetical protein DPMN_156494 [Dreissena polymorpha]|uniref:Uncharacterized protein n=1 Tax=Dreissena polymorpha TaxID=45954 RepID=A0A9D4FP46_DREPO|nr:hypothetical protein DPMN_156494 [Dreissena polymorpha]
MHNAHERSKCGENFLHRKIPMVRERFEPGTSRTLSQRSTITPQLQLIRRLHKFNVADEPTSAVAHAKRALSLANIDRTKPRSAQRS